MSAYRASIAVIRPDGSTVGLAGLADIIAPSSSLGRAGVKPRRHLGAPTLNVGGWPILTADDFRRALSLTLSCIAQTPVTTARGRRLRGQYRTVVDLNAAAHRATGAQYR